jgi:hypothetical protein
MKETCGRFKNASGRLFALPLFAMDGGAECQSDLTSPSAGAPPIAYTASRREMVSFTLGPSLLDYSCRKKCLWITVIGKRYLWITAVGKRYLWITVIGKRYLWITVVEKDISGSRL